ncbi:MAG: DUF2116 family Zn-ribbon domain-containing protein [candidate division Zixibacteria bacterium]|nr:DUF2116 family Zn-ribbon domain-containing protein [candidate division Zixibacteria bacterium]
MARSTTSTVNPLSSFISLTGNGCSSSAQLVLVNKTKQVRQQSKIIFCFFILFLIIFLFFYSNDFL